MLSVLKDQFKEDTAMLIINYFIEDAEGYKLAIERCLRRRYLHAVPDNKLTRNHEKSKDVLFVQDVSDE